MINALSPPSEKMRVGAFATPPLAKIKVKY